MVELVEFQLNYFNTNNPYYNLIKTCNIHQYTLNTLVK